LLIKRGEPSNALQASQRFDKIPASVFYRVLFRFVLPAAIGAVVGFLALAFAIQNEPSLSPAVVVVLSPGLKVAEFLVPVKHESLGSTFGGFLRVAIAVNVIFYFLLCALAVNLLGQGRSHDKAHKN
jgi:hypothetical protein